MATRITVVLNMSDMSVTEKIHKAQQVLDNLNNNPAVFENPGTLFTELEGAINNLRAAQQAASDGGKTNTAVMHDKEEALMEVMLQVAAYLSRIAKGDAGVVHLAGLDIKRRISRQKPEFEVTPGTAPGSVNLRTKARKDMFYKFQYSPEPMNAGSWIDVTAGKLSRATLTGLAPGFYWFRIVLIDAISEHAGEALRLAVQ